MRIKTGVKIIVLNKGKDECIGIKREEKEIRNPDINKRRRLEILA